MSAKVARMDIKEFREEGYLQEANRLFFHPLGLALEVVVDSETGSERLGGVWDYRSDAAGIIYESLGEDGLRKARHIRSLRDSLGESRRRELGYVIQPALKGDR